VLVPRAKSRGGARPPGGIRPKKKRLKLRKSDKPAWLMREQELDAGHYMTHSLLTYNELT